MLIIHISIMTCSDQVFHNKYLLTNDIFGHCKWYYTYSELRDGNLIAENGLLSLLQLKATHENNLVFTCRAMNLAARNGHLDVVQWLHANRGEGCQDLAMDMAAGYGHLEIVQWLHANRKEGCSSLAMTWAAQRGYLDIVKWLHANNCIESCTDGVLTKAVRNGHLEIVRFLYENRSELRSCRLYHRAMNQAAAGGNLEIVQYLRENKDHHSSIGDEN